MSNLRVEDFPFLETEGPGRETWWDLLRGKEPEVDRNGFLTGMWGRAVIDACRYEYSHQEYLDYGWRNGPVGFIGDYMQALNPRWYEEYIGATDQLENRTREQLMEGEGLGKMDPGDADVLSVPICEPEGYHEKMAEAMDDTFWCFVCGCCGSGVGGCGDPMCLASQKTCCIETAAYTEDCWGDDGPCFAFQKICCIVQHQTLWPGGGPNDGVPICACCNLRCGGDGNEDKKLTMVNTNAKIMSDAFLCYYALCCGCGLSTNFPMVKGDQKCFCFRSFASTASCCPADRGCCYTYQKACCCTHVTMFPPGGGKYDGIPCCACCGMKCGGEDDHEDSS